MPPFEDAAPPIWGAILLRENVYCEFTKFTKYLWTTVSGVQAQLVLTVECPIRRSADLKKTRMNILLVEGDPAQAAAVDRAMQQSGHTIDKVDRGESAVRFLKVNKVDLVVLDWQLPGMTGFEVLHWIRSNLGTEPAVLFLTSRVLEVDIVRALEAGADEYVVKPFRTAELAARAGSLLRRARRNEKIENTIAVGPYILDTTQRSVMFDNKTLKLTAKEFDVVAYLFANVGRVVSRDLLAKLAWGRELDRTSRTVDTHICRIRRKLSLRPENGVRLSSVYTHGYRLDEVDLGGPFSLSGTSRKRLKLFNRKNSTLLCHKQRCWSNFHASLSQTRICLSGSALPSAEHLPRPPLTLAFFTMTCGIGENMSGMWVAEAMQKSPPTRVSARRSRREAGSCRRPFAALDRTSRSPESRVGRRPCVCCGSLGRAPRASLALPGGLVAVSRAVVDSGSSLGKDVLHVDQHIRLATKGDERLVEVRRAALTQYAKHAPQLSHQR